MSDQSNGNAFDSGSYTDKNLTCRDCSQEFVWTAGEQEFYAKKGFERPPARCAVCRAKYKAAREQFGRVETKITCSKCGGPGTVPFVPKNPDNVLCRDCFSKQKRG